LGDDLDLPVSYEILLAIIGILITCFVAYRQDRQNRKIENIGTETKDIAQTLKTDAVTQKNVESFSLKMIKNINQFVTHYFFQPDQTLLEFLSELHLYPGLLSQYFHSYSLKLH
jgi:predicted histidine transporter YuiF (NhaC family)